MKRSFLFIIALYTIAGCGSPSIVIPEKQTDISVDGSLGDWNPDSFLPYENGKLLINLAYDSRFIYLACRCTDRNTGRLFALNGVRIWLDPEGTHERNLGMDIRYPGERKFDFGKGNFFAVLNDEERSKALDEIDKINNGVLLIDKKTMKSKAFTNNTDSPFSGKMLIRGNDLVFEVKIPRDLHTYFNDFADLKFNLSTIEITTGESPFGSFRNMRGGMMGGRGITGFPGAGIPGGRRAVPLVSIPEIRIKLNNDESSNENPN